MDLTLIFVAFGAFILGILAGIVIVVEDTAGRIEYSENELDKKIDVHIRILDPNKIRKERFILLRTEKVPKIDLNDSVDL